jgi:ribonuclease HI
MRRAVTGKEDLSYALKLLASGQRIDEVWEEAGFTSRKALASRLFELADKAPSKHLRLVAYSDGASSGNPGDSGCGVVILDESGQTLLEDYKYVGRTTNNVAEYEGAILALDKASQLGASEVELRVDSSLLANQIKGGYKVKSRRLVTLYQNLMKKVKLFDKFEVTLIRGSENKQADRLANLAISAHKGG